MWSDSSRRADFREFPKYYGDVITSRVSEYFRGLAVSAKYSAFTVESRIGFLPNDFQTHLEQKAASGRRAEYGSKVYTVPSIPKCLNEESIHDLKFHPLDDTCLVSSHENRLLQVWRLPSYQELGDIPSAAHRVDGFSSDVSCLQFHPSANHVLSVGGSDALFMLDMNHMKVNCQVSGVFGDNVVCTSFTSDGSLIRGITRNGTVFALDPRVEAKGAEDVVLGRVDCVPESISHVSHLGDNLVLITGQTQFKEPIVKLFDVSKGRNTDWVNPVLKRDYDLKGCYSLVAYDPWTHLVYVSFRDTADLQAFEIDSALQMNKVSQYHSKQLFESFCLMPKHGIRTRDINKVVKLGKDRIQMVPHTRGGKVIYESIHKKLAPSLGADEYFAGQNAVRKGVCALVSGDFEEKDSRKTSPFLHCAGHESMQIDDHYTHIVTSNVQTPLGQNIKANGAYAVFPAKATGGGALAVIDHRKTGRQRQAEIRAHKDHITCFDLSSLNEGRLVATGSTDCKVYVWRLPLWTESLAGKELAIEEVACLQHTGKLSYVGFHPRVADLLITCEKGILRGWQLDGSSEPRVAVEMSGLGESPITDVQWDTTGHLAALSGDMIRIVAFTNESVVTQFECLENKRDTKVFWVNNDACLITLGFGKGSSRRMSLWDVSAVRAMGGDDDGKDDRDDKDKEEIECKMIAEATFGNDNAIPVAHYDRDTGLIFLSFIGSRRIRIYEVSGGITEMAGDHRSNRDLTGMTFLPKKYCEVPKVEIGKCLKLTRSQIDAISFIVPRKRKEYFQDDLFPDTLDNERALYASVEEYMAEAPLSTEENWDTLCAKAMRSMRPDGMTELSSAPSVSTAREDERKRQEKLRAEEKLKDQPRSTEQAMEQFSRMVADTANANRWDAIPIGTEVEDDEWDD